MTATRRQAILLCFVLAVPSTSQAQLWSWPFKSKAEQIVDQAQSARERSEFRLAASLLEEAEASVSPPRARIFHERGLLARDRGQYEEAARHLHQSAELEPRSRARVDHAAVLVELGRWPEAVVVLRRAFGELGYALRVDEVVSDMRFVKLAGFQPYKTLLERQRLEQEGPLASLSLKLERIDSSTQTSSKVSERLAVPLTFLWRLSSSFAAPIVLLILLGLLLSFGFHQTRLIKPPWTLIAGMLAAGVLWHLGARVATADESRGWTTIAVSLGVVLVPWGVVAGLGWLGKRKRASLVGDPFAKEHLPKTLVIIEETARQGVRFLQATESEEAAEALRQAELALRQRLSTDDR